MTPISNSVFADAPSRFTAEAVESCDPEQSIPSAQVHDFIRKLRRPEVMPDVVQTLRSFKSRQPNTSLADTLRSRYGQIQGPISVNLDLTVACNYHCTHCIDGPILNTGRQFAFQNLCRSLVILRMAGLRSVILIGGGEPTLHPKFFFAVCVIKKLGMQCAIVSNGSNMARIMEIAPLLADGDWVRLSLDAATDETFRAMHLPRRDGINLQTICNSVRGIKRANSKVAIGFSYIVSWQGATVRGQPIVDNVDEMAAAARLAKKSGFDFIAFKPLLDRDELGGEAIGIDCKEVRVRRELLVRRIFMELEAARRNEDKQFRVLGSLNLCALAESKAIARMRSQPHHCHMRLFRQVVTPTGIFGCPAYRGNPKDRIGPETGYNSVEAFFRSRRRALELTESFDAAVECCHIACIYNSANRWLEAVRAEREDPVAASTGLQEFFL